MVVAALDRMLDQRLEQGVALLRLTVDFDLQLDHLRVAYLFESLAQSQIVYSEGDVFTLGIVEHAGNQTIGTQTGARALSPFLTRR